MTFLGNLVGDFNWSAFDNLRVVGIDLGTTNSTVCEVLWPKGEHDPCPP